MVGGIDRLLAGSAPVPVETPVEGALHVSHGEFSDSVAGWCFHRGYALHLVRGGAGTVCVGDYCGDYEPGELMLIGPYLAHCWKPDGVGGEGSDSGRLQIRFSESLWRPSNPALAELEGVGTLLQRASRGLTFHGDTRAQAQGLISQLVSARGCRRLALFYLLLDLLAGSTQSRPLASEGHRFPARSRAGERIQTILDHLDTHYDHPLSQASVAARFGMSAGHLCRCFKQELGIGFVEYVNHLRIDKSCELLAGSDRPITDICFEVGFRNISNFNRRFVAAKGMNPSEYRRAARTAAPRSADR